MADKSVSGTFTDKDGNPVEGATVLLWREKNPNLVATTTTDADGNYSFSKHPDATGKITEWHVSGYHIFQGSTREEMYNTLTLPRVPAALSRYNETTYSYFTDGETIDVAGVVGSVRVEMAAGSGQGGEEADYGSPGSGGSGGYIEFEFDVSEYSELSVWAGGGNGSRAGYNYGGSGEQVNYAGDGGNGGGSSAVLDGQGNILAYAGGGGGGAGAKGRVAHEFRDVEGGDGGNGGGPGGGSGGPGSYGDGGNGGQDANVGTILNQGGNGGNGYVIMFVGE